MIMKKNNLYNLYLSKKITKKNYIKRSFYNQKKLFKFKELLNQSDVKEIIISKDEISLKIKAFNNNIKQSNFIRLIVDTNDSRSIPLEILNFKTFEKKEKFFLLKFAKIAKNILDVGANIGWYSLNFSLLKNVKSIHSFEPIPQTFSQFKKHIKINKSKKIILNNIALSDKIQKSMFYISSESGSASMRTIQQKKNIKKILCKTLTIDKYVKRKKISCDFIKIDVEGSELFVLKGSINTLTKYKPIIFVELLRKWSKKFNYHPNDVINLLKKIKYSCYYVKKGKLKKISKITNSTTATNFFFFHNIKHSKIKKF